MPGPMMRAEQWGSWSVSFPAGTAVAVSNFPTTQPVSGTVSVGNFPATQQVAGTVTANVTFPSTQQISGSVSVSNFPASQAVTGTFWQAVQPVGQSGAWAVNQAGTWTVQAVQSGTWTIGGTVTANLGTLNGAATTAKQDAIIAALANRLAVDDYRVPNPAAAGGIVPKVTTNVSAFIASAVPCNFFGAAVITNTDAVGAYVFVLNRTTIPASGSTINMAEVVAMTGYGAGGGASLVPDQVPDRYTVGCVIIITTSITTYTPVTGANLPRFIKARVL